MSDVREKGQDSSSDSSGSSMKAIEIPIVKPPTTASSYRKVFSKYEDHPFANGGQSPPSLADGKQPVIHNKLYCEQIKERLDKLHIPGHHNLQIPTTVSSPSLVSPSSSSQSSSVLQKLKTDEIKHVRSHTELAETANGVRMLAKNLARATIQLDVKAIMVVTKARDNSLIYLTREVAEWLLTVEREIVVYVDGKLKSSKRFDAEGLVKTIPRAKTYLRYWNKSFALRNPEQFDLVVTLGGDGTVLYVSNLFQRVVPPVLSFSLGSLGFLTNFKFDQFREKMTSAVESGVRAYLRMRFTCRVHKANGRLVCEQQVLNELVVDRGPSPYVTQLELYGDGSLLTIAQADGLIIATPTGSTAYSLSAGGSLVHPGVSAISVTPICPHTLSFRPILLPDGMLLKVKVPKSSRSTAWASFDGKVRTELFKGDYVTIQASPFPFPTVISSKTDYIDSVSRNLNWNVRETQKPFASLLNNKPSATAAETPSKMSRKSSENKKNSIGEMNGLPHIGNAYSDDDNCDDDCGDEDEDDYDSGASDQEDGANGEHDGNNANEEDEEHEKFDIDTDEDDELSESIVEEEERRLRNQIESEISTTTTTSTSSVSSDEDSHIPFLPEAGGGLSTPPPNNPGYRLEERTCYAHPNARITLRE